ncbi:hypothetical protein [Reichenbachiella ulvae]|uniref:DUF3592 domain-containing protein n=1 Tax=Reichenbachiella ulvae TaxID=2980104 RepID=A0ABT3CSN6_9BACT|nr:hypothetical protein [Reichenbachiella ulvae]MCV9386596.1 hypothetical protein [Reichenbachiella ulvae]
MQLILEQEEGKNLKEEELHDAAIGSIVNSIDWSKFTFLTLKRDEGNWIEISGNLAEDGLAILIEKEGVQEISEFPPESVSEVEEVLVDYYNGRMDRISRYFEPKYRPFHLDMAESRMIIEYPSLTRRIIVKLASVVFALSLVAFVYWALNLWFTHDFKFLGHDTAITAATVVETKYRPYMKSMVQIAKYEFVIDDKTYEGYFRAATSTTRKHNVGDRVKIKYAIDDPSISRRLATYVSD